jgi:hypothetical protein
VVTTALCEAPAGRAARPGDQLLARPRLMNQITAATMTITTTM